MARFGIVASLLGAALIACVPLQPVRTDAGRAIQAMPASELDESFLYLAAIESLHGGRPDLSIRFLDMLLDKDPQAWTPRLLLAEVLLARKDATAALEHCQFVLAGEDVPAERRQEALILRAKIYVFTGREHEALQDIEAILADKPEQLPIRMQHIDLLQRLGRFDDAHASIAQALKLQPNAHLYRIDAQLYINQGDLDKADAALEQAMAANPDDESLVLMRSDLAVGRNRAGQAEDMLKAFIATNPMGLQAANALGRLLLNQQRFDEAVSIYEDLAEKTNRHPEVMTALGLIHYQREDYVRAADAFRQSLDKQPSNDAVRFYLAASLEATGQIAEARDIYDAIDTRSDDYTGAQLRLAAIDFDQGRLDAAAARLKELVSEQPELIDAHMMLSGIRLRQKNYTALIEESEPAIGIEPVATGLLFNRAIAFESLKQFDRVNDTLTLLLKIEPDNAEALNFLGYSMADRGVNLQAAEDMIRKALQVKPGDGYFLDSLAWVLYRRGKFDEALAVQRQAVATVADDPIMQDHLGDILWMAAETEQARKAWQRAIDLDHEDPDELRRKISQGLQPQ